MNDKNIGSQSKSILL